MMLLQYDCLRHHSQQPEGDAAGCLVTDDDRDSLLFLPSCSWIGESEQADHQHHIQGEYLEHCQTSTFSLQTSTTRQLSSQRSSFSSCIVKETLTIQRRLTLISLLLNISHQMRHLFKKCIYIDFTLCGIQQQVQNLWIRQ